METSVWFEPIVLFLFVLVIILFYVVWKLCVKNNELIMENKRKDRYIDILNDRCLLLENRIREEREVNQMRLDAANRRTEEVLGVAIANLHKLDLG